MADDDKTDIEKIKTMKASAAVAILREIESIFDRHHENISSAVILDLANAYKIVAENAPKPAVRVGKL